ncbi:hypothetical protein F511_18734 [Dorcoceras hygrometricum]|uniref:Uncharacterized protein n=1 Tax=Dorcoceras hygrometricum TaxID=472368 RepID=A0A2Z7B1W8_9LAMI|nr:hypothetical protein F511_18734 [Dorcoceras hygrometricum]
MTSSLISNTNQVHFASVLAMDNARMVAMFEALVASGLNGFLGIADGRIDDISEVPKDLIFDARTEFSFTGERLTTSCKKRELNIEYRILSDILAKSITVKAGISLLFDAVTHERFLTMTDIFGGVSVNWGRLLFKIFKDMVTPETRQARGYAVHTSILLKSVPNLNLGDSKEFPPLKILTARTVGRYIAINEKIAVEDVEDAGNVSRAKKTPVKMAVSKKRLAVAVDEQVVKKKRTLKGKAAPSKEKLELVSVAQEAIPLQIVAPILAVSAVLHSKPKRKAPKMRLQCQQDRMMKLLKKRRLLVLDTDVEGTDFSGPDVGVQAVQRADEMEHWFNASYEEFVAREADRMIESGSDTDEEIVAYQLREQVIDEVEQLFNSFSFKKMAALKIEDIYAKEEHVLTWGETDSTRIALQRRFDDKLAVIRNELLEFRVETQGQLASLGTNLAELIAFITKGSDDKKGEVSSSHGRGQPPLDDRNRPSRGSGGSGGSSRRDERKDSSKRRSSSGGGGSGAGGETYGPYNKCET